MIYNNLDMSKDEVNCLLKMDHVRIVPVMNYSFDYEPDRMYYQVGNIQLACKKDCVLSILKNQREVVFVPMIVQDKSSGSNGLLPEGSQKLLFPKGLNFFSNGLYKEKYGNELPSIVQLRASILNNSYEKDTFGSLYFLDHIEEGKYQKVREIHEHFITKLGLTYSTVSPTGVNIKVSKRDKINMYDIVKYSNYIKLKGYGDNTLYLDIELNGKYFNVFNVKSQLVELMDYFFEE